jgi:hypothetical protein
MGKLKVRLSFKEFTLELEGSREEVPQIGQNLGRQIAGLIAAPASNLVQEQIPAPAVNEHSNGSSQTGKKPKVRKSGSKSETAAINWTYDGQLYGAPTQNWSGNDKAIWTLYVADKVMGLKQMGAAQITKTFNEHYQAAKIIHRGNVYKGLDNLRTGEDAPVGKRDDGSFFLTQAGHKFAEKLIANLIKPEATA